MAIFSLKENTHIKEQGRDERITRGERYYGRKRIKRFRKTVMVHSVEFCGEKKEHRFAVCSWI